MDLPLSCENAFATLVSNPEETILSSVALSSYQETPRWKLAGDVSLLLKACNQLLRLLQKHLSVK